MSQVVIEFERDIPKRIAEVLLKDIQQEGHLVDLSLVEHWDYDFTQFVADITLTFNHEFTRSVFSALVAQALLEAFRKISLLVKRQGDKKPSIELKIDDANSTVRFSVEGDFEDAKRAMNAFLDAVKKGYVEEVLKDPKHIDKQSRKRKAHFHYNKEDKLRLKLTEKQDGEARFRDERDQD